MNFTKILYQIRNWRAHWRAFWQGSWVEVGTAGMRVLSLFERLTGKVSARGRMIMRGELFAQVIRADGSRADLGCLGRRVVTTAGVTFMRDDFNDGGSDINLFNYHDSGTGVAAEAIGNTALGTPFGGARVSGTKSVPAATQFRTVATIPYTSSLAITEHGLFSAATVGTLWDRTVFTAVNVVNGESIEFTYTLTISDGG